MPTRDESVDAGPAAESDRLVVVYERVSSDKQDISRQAVQRERAAADHPGRERRVIQDDGHSAYRTSIFDRPGGRELCALVEQGVVEAIYADAQDRLSRGKQSEWWNFADLCELNGTRIVIDGRELRLGEDDNDEIRSALDAILARRESREKSHRVKGGKRRTAERGLRTGGIPPYGYSQLEGVLTVVAHEAAVVRRMRDEVLSGLALSDIADGLNRDGVRTRRGKRWSQSAVSRTLAINTLAGYVKNRGEWFPGLHDPIFAADEWAELQAALESRRRTPSRGRGRKPMRHLLAKGMLRCSHCGEAIAPRRTTNAQGRVYELYVCSGRLSGSRKGCPMPSAHRAPIDSALLAYFSEAVHDRDETARRLAQQFEAAMAEVGALHEGAERQAALAEDRLGRVKGDYLAGRIEADEWREFSRELTADRDAAAAEAERLARRRDGIAAEAAGLDAEDELVRFLAEVRAAVAGSLDDASSLDAVRSALRRVFDGFTLHSYAAPADEPAPLPEGWVRSRPYLYPALCVPGGGAWLIEPHPRRDLILGADPQVGFPELRRVPLEPSVRVTPSRRRRGGSARERPRAPPRAQRRRRRPRVAA